MYLITKQQSGYQAIPIKAEDRWDFHKLFVGRKEIRIILRLRGRRYLLYHTRELTAKYPKLTRAQLTPLCDEIIASVSDRITHGDEYIDFGKIAAAAECRHHAHWRDKGLFALIPMEDYFGHPIDPKSEQLMSHVRVDLDGLIVMDHEPPVYDCVQDELPY